jgi:hypothetical protein
MQAGERHRLVARRWYHHLVRNKRGNLKTLA